MNDQDSILDDALESYPITPLPPKFVEQVMGHVVQLPQAYPYPRFKLQFLDLALPAFLAFFMSLVLFVGMWLTGIVEAAWLPDVQLTLLPTGQTAVQEWSWLGVGLLVLLVEALLIFVTCSVFWLDKPFPGTSHL